jgi:hypothetical protein
MATNGNCYLCGKEGGKTALKNHILKYHNEGDVFSRLIKVEGMHDKNYWLLISMPLNSTLSTLDKFLRDIWLECCGHLSMFYFGYYEAIGKGRSVEEFRTGARLGYEYDFGTATNLLITIGENVMRSKQRPSVLLMARNQPPKLFCENCDNLAVVHHPLDYETFCKNCAEKHKDSAEYEFMRVVNSPRSGVCGYEFEPYKWEFYKERTTSLKPVKRK